MFKIVSVSLRGADACGGAVGAMFSFLSFCSVFRTQVGPAHFRMYALRRLLVPLTHRLHCLTHSLSHWLAFGGLYPGFSLTTPK